MTTLVRQCSNKLSYFVTRNVGIRIPHLMEMNRPAVITNSVLHSSSHSHQMNQSSAQPVFDKVNQLIVSKNLGQTFAVIHLYGHQHLVHLGDIIAVSKPIAADIGEKIKLEKCLLVGNENFSLVGRPILNRDLVQVEATIVEKTMTQTFFNVFAIPRYHGFRKYPFQRFPLTMLRITDITVCHPLNTTQKRIN